MEITAILIWWIIITLLGFIGWPLARSLFRHLPDQGFAFARPLGLLITGYILWLGGTFRLLQNNLGGIFISGLIVLGVGWFWQRRQPQTETMLDWAKARWRYLLSVELLFHLAFIGWAIFKSYNPNIETAGGEKWMEIAFINGTLRSDYFPPQDPWLSGFAISYYYFGYVLMAMLTQVSGLDSVVAFNLYVPTLFAMTMGAAFGILANLVTLHQEDSDITDFPAIITGLVAAIFVALMGNLQGLLEVLHKADLMPHGFWTWLDIRDIKELPVGPSESWIPDRFIWWWRGSRVLTDYNLIGQEQEVIDEFPFFSFLLGDVHPHVLALPFVLLTVGLALNLVVSPTESNQGEDQDDNNNRSPLSRIKTGWRSLEQATGGRLAFVLYAICIGGLSFLNTWDFPIYLGVMSLSFILWLEQRHHSWLKAVEHGFIGALILGIASVLLYLPFYVTFRSQAKGFLPNLWNPTRFPQFFVFFGPFLVAIVALLLVLALRSDKNWLSHLRWTLIITILGPILLLLLAVGLILFTPTGQEYVQGVLNNPEIQAAIGGQSIGNLMQTALTRRLSNPWTFLFLGGVSAWAFALGLGNSTPKLSLSVRFVLILILVGLGLPLVVEVIYLRDNFGTRMNTIFKFYFQAWVLMGLASTFAFYYVTRFLPMVIREIWLIVMLLLVAGGMVYPTLATFDKTNYFRNESTLNGIQWVSQRYPDDYAGITWLDTHAISDDAVILEAPGARYAAYQYTGRVSALTGLPTLLGWGGHQDQWRGNYEEPARREPDIEALFNTTNLAQAQELLDKYGITYVYVGPLERERYSPQGLRKFETLMDVAFEQGEVTIYER